MNGRDRILLGCGPAAGVVLVIAVAWASAVTPGFSQSADTISRLAAPGQPHPWILRSGLVLCGLLSAAFGAGLFRSLRRGLFRWGVLAGLAVFGIATAITGLARDYPVRGGSAPEWQGALHNAAARFAIYGIIAAMAALVPAALGRQSAHRHSAAVSAVALTLVAVTGLFYPEVSASVRGLVQRLALSIVFAWMAAAAVIARRAAGR